MKVVENAFVGIIILFYRSKICRPMGKTPFFRPIFQSFLLQYTCQALVYIVSNKASLHVFKFFFIYFYICIKKFVKK